MKKKWLIAIILVFLISLFLYKLQIVVDLYEELPAIVEPTKIMRGAIMAYHPDLLYQKYRINFVTNNQIIKKDGPYQSDKSLKEYYYYYKGIKEIPEYERNILITDKAQSFLAYQNSSKIYLLTISGDHSGSANYRKIIVKLYRINNANTKLIFHSVDNYSVDPGFDSNYFTEKIKYLFYKYIFRDDRYH